MPPKHCKFRQNISQLSEAETTDTLGTLHMAFTMTKFGWRDNQSKQMDNQKVDATYRAGLASIDIQLKSSNFKGKRWNWNIAKNKYKEKEIAFYKEPFDFLFLVGLELERDAKLGYLEISPPQLALIPGKVVLKHFEGRPAKHLVLGLSKSELSEDPWRKYFGIENISKILEKTKKDQEKEEELLKETRGKNYE
jgi:hypothetical protein